MRPITSKDAKQALYAVAGVADVAVSTVRHLPREAEKLRARLPQVQQDAARTYNDLVRRGESLVESLRGSPPGRQGTQVTRVTVKEEPPARAPRSGAKSSTSTRRGGAGAKREQ